MRFSFVIIVLAISANLSAQTFSIQKGDSINFLMLTTDSMQDKWKLPYPVYQFQTGDIDGDGKTDAMVGVIKRTRFLPIGKRLFIFKDYDGYIRAMWMGSKLGGILQDFKFANGLIRSLEKANAVKWFVAEYKWNDFGMSFVRFIIKDTNEYEARKVFTDVNRL